MSYARSQHPQGAISVYVTLTACRIPLRFLFHKGYIRDNGKEIVFRRILHIIFFFKIRRNPHYHAHLSKSS